VATRSRRRAVCPALILVTLVLGPSLVAASPAGDIWLGMYFHGTKIGYTHVNSAKVTYRGIEAIRDVSKSVTRLEMLGQTVSQTVDLVSYSDSKHRPIHQEYRMASTGSVTTITAEYHANTIECVVDAGSGPTRKTIAIPPGAQIVSDMDSAQFFDSNAVGRKAVVYSLNPLMVTLDRSESEVVGKETVLVDRKEYSAFRIVSSTPMGKITSWEGADGGPIRVETPVGITEYAETEIAAKNMQSAEPKFTVSGAVKYASPAGAAYVPPRDFAVGTSVAADRTIADPLRLRALTIELHGIEDPHLAITDGRQRVVPVDNERGAYRFEITVPAFSAARAISLPMKPPAALRDLTRPASYIESNAPQIVKTAVAIRGAETNAYRVASRIRAWVNQNMQPDYTIGVPRSCVDIFKNRRGVCRDYATLFVAICRAAGIPARIAGGIVYMGGRFYYHAWGECWVGKWVSFDPTRPTDFVDATHIKLVQGGVTEMFEVVNVVGRLKARILRVGTKDTVRVRVRSAQTVAQLAAR
jgi:hypothetical protein